MEARLGVDVRLLAARLDQLELTLLEVVTALGMLVGELALREDLSLEKPGVVEEALERGWQTLFGAAVDRSDLTDARPEWADPVRLAAVAPDALADAMEATGAAVGAVYAVDDDARAIRVLAWAGYPAEVMAAFSSFSLDAELPAADAARSRQALWFAERGEILEQYPHLRDAHEETEAALGTAGVQGAVVPLLAGDRVAAVVLLGFTVDAASPDPERLHAVRERITRALAARDR